ncbi:hypothetical protein [Neptunomonas japonica]|uniref:hypothetical protein n=1 Tax=Neptunomonas japonica TaxID=417574 RepID=UPI0006852524|nr:hypothetical protein [Neptunomonas japonica]
MIISKSLCKACVLSIISVVLILPTASQAAGFADRQDNRQENRSDDRRDDRQYDRVDDRRDDRVGYRRDDRPYEYRDGKRLVVVAPRERHFRNVVVIRPHGHAYYGYGRYTLDDDAWKWMAFTAITLKVLDNIDEQAQREHEAAQVRATTAPIGNTIYWDTGDAAGYVVATKQGISSNGATCREFQQVITVGGKKEQAYGTACLQADGAWKIIS